MLCRPHNPHGGRTFMVHRDGWPQTAQHGAWDDPSRGLVPWLLRTRDEGPTLGWLSTPVTTRDAGQGAKSPQQDPVLWTLPRALGKRNRIKPCSVVCPSIGLSGDAQGSILMEIVGPFMVWDQTYLWG